MAPKMKYDPSKSLLALINEIIEDLTKSYLAGDEKSDRLLTWDGEFIQYLNMEFKAMFSKLCPGYIVSLDYGNPYLNGIPNAKVFISFTPFIKSSMIARIMGEHLKIYNIDIGILETGVPDDYEHIVRISQNPDCPGGKLPASDLPRYVNEEFLEDSGPYVVFARHAVDYLSALSPKKRRSFEDCVSGLFAPAKENENGVSVSEVNSRLMNKISREIDRLPSFVPRMFLRQN